MKAELVSGNVRAHCPDCDGAVTTFELKAGGGEFGTVIVNKDHVFEGKKFTRTLYKLLRCAGCGRGGVAKLHDTGHSLVLDEFVPFSIDSAKIPKSVPEKITADFREAELCSSFGALRAASALIRSALEKTLKENGYTKGNLKEKINLAADDGVITEVRKKRAHDDIRVLGNDVLHDEWRKVTQEEVDLAHHYTQRILEDFYDDRNSVERILKKKKRIETISESA